MVDDIKILLDFQFVVGFDFVEIEIFVLVELVWDLFGCFYVIGKWKDVVVWVWVKLGLGKMIVNGKDYEVYFVCFVLQMILCQLFQIVGVEGEFDVMVMVKGGGFLGQVGVVCYGILKVL